MALVYLVAVCAVLRASSSFANRRDRSCELLHNVVFRAKGTNIRSVTGLTALDIALDGTHPHDEGKHKENKNEF